MAEANMDPFLEKDDMLMGWLVRLCDSSVSQLHLQGTGMSQVV